MKTGKAWTILTPLNLDAEALAADIWQDGTVSIIG